MWEVNEEAIFDVERSSRQTERAELTDKDLGVVGGKRLREAGTIGTYEFDSDLECGLTSFDGCHRSRMRQGRQECQSGRDSKELHSFNECGFR